MTTAPVTYTIWVQGHLDDHWATWLGGADLRRHDDGTTSLTIHGADQAKLHGVLAGLRDIGAVLVEFHTSSRQTGTGTPVHSARETPSEGGDHRVVACEALGLSGRHHRAVDHQALGRAGRHHRVVQAPSSGRARRHHETRGLMMRVCDRGPLRA